MENVIKKITAIWIDDIPPPKKQIQTPDEPARNQTDEPIEDKWDMEITPPN